MNKKQNLLSTINGSLLENFYPKGWDLEKIDECASNSPNRIYDFQTWWNKDFMPVSCNTIEEFNVKMGHEIAQNITRTKEEGKKLVLILPVGPMGMYKWVVFFLKEWNVSADHVYGFNMDEWSDMEGNTLPALNTASFRYAMEKAFYGPLKELTIPESQRNFATKDNLPYYPEKINKLLDKGAELIVVFGIGRVFHIAFWEPHFAGEFADVEEWKKQTHRLGAKLHPLTVEQNAITSFKSKTKTMCNI